jgi:hypothetical protein
MLAANPIAKHQMLDDLDLSTFDVLDNCHPQNQGQHRDAEILYKQCLDKQKSVLGENHPDTLTAMNYLAGAYGRQGKHRDAEVLLKQCLGKRKVALGENHPDTLTTMSNLATAYYSQGKLRDAGTT